MVNRTYDIKFSDGENMEFNLYMNDETTRIECDGYWIEFDTPDPEDTYINDIDNSNMALEAEVGRSYFTVRVFMATYLIVKHLFPNIEEANYTNKCVIDEIDDVSEKSKEQLYKQFVKCHWRLFYYYRVGFYVTHMDTAEQYVQTEWDEINSWDYGDEELQDYFFSGEFKDGPKIHCELMEVGKKLFEKGYSTSKNKIKFGSIRYKY